ncbi:metal-dependent membrane protease [Halogeometricum borinquense DSM 11551]|uniref:Metal-dependent membrane protease n=2 Tax=Halogeometricum borinquense TaxID=60847 RepID=E4NM64_HALBP|nr:CPBP family intramembrane glutamic endopeptidase [Halogeometricum borinquense]ADQ66163.1 predicted metal-dependent membrane protease [Halogeometricum borinquense DSM 11551]ELY27342.1 metal-dependent membrane protease [Halogeometricum borinquense DSM 11551]RYJ14800.1 CPBP family intramembrane metalloprotease [Halogeometricum borinquense]
MASDVSSQTSDLPAPVRAFGSVALVVVLVLLCASIFVSFGTAIFRTVGIDRGSALYIALRSGSQFVGFGVAAVGYLTVTDQWELVYRRVPSLRDLKWITAGFGVLLVLYLAINVGLTALGIDSGDSAVAATAEGQPVLLLYYIPVTLLLVAPTEELVFRGVVQGLFRREYGVPFAIAGSSLTFASIHATSFTGEGAVVSLIVVLILGGVLGIVYEKSESLVVPVVAHGLYNTVQFAATYAMAVGLVGSV